MFSSNRFLVIGRAGMDLTPTPVGVSIEEADTCSVSLGGSSANISVALRRHGCRAALLTCVSDDAIGRYCLGQLDRYGVERDHVRVVGGEHRNSLAVTEARVEGHQTVIYRNAAADFEMSMADVEAIDYSAFAALITTGTVLAQEPSRSAGLRAFDLARQAGIALIFDVDYRPYSWASAADASEVYSRTASLCDIIVGNDVEFGFMAGDYERGLEKARQLAADHAGIVVYKRGELGAITFQAELELHTGIYPVKAVKPTGAGDAFLGGFIASLSTGHELKQALLRGSACASLVVTRSGCAPAMPTADELDNFLESHPGPEPS